MAYADVVIADTPASYWRLGEVVSSTEVVDEMGRIDDADTDVQGVTLGEVGLLTADGDTCGDWDGTNDYISIADPDDVPDWSIEFWVEPDLDSGQNLINESTDSAPPGGAISNEIAIDSDVFSARIWDGGANFVTSTTTVVPDTRYHIVLTASDSGNMEIWVDADMEDSEPLGTKFDFGGGGFWRVGGNSSSFPGWFNGKIDELAIYHRVLSEAEIEEHFNAGITNPAVVLPYLGLHEVDLNSLALMDVDLA